MIGIVRDRLSIPSAKIRNDFHSIVSRIVQKLLHILLINIFRVDTDNGINPGNTKLIEALIGKVTP